MQLALPLAVAYDKDTAHMSRKFRKRAHPTGSGADASGANAGPAKTGVAIDLAPSATQPSIYSDHNICVRKRKSKGDDCPRTTQLHDLPGELLQRIADELPPNEVPCSLRIVCRELASRLHSPQHTTIRVGTYQQCGDLARRALVPAPMLLHRWAAPGAGRCLTLKQKQQLLCCAARCGSVEVLQQLEAALGCEAPREAVWSAAEEGHGHVCDWLMDRTCPVGAGKPKKHDSSKAFAGYWGRGYLAREAALCTGHAGLYRKYGARGCCDSVGLYPKSRQYDMAATGSCHQQVCELFLRHAEASRQAVDDGGRESSSSGSDDSGASSCSGGSSSSQCGSSSEDNSRSSSSTGDGSEISSHCDKSSEDNSRAGSCRGGIHNSSSDSSDSSCRLQDAAHGLFWAVTIDDEELVPWLLRRAEEARQGPVARQPAAFCPAIMSIQPLLGYAAYGCDLPTLRRMHEMCHSAFRYACATRPHLWELDATDWKAHLDWAMAGAMCSPTADWQAKVEWLVREQGYPRGPNDVLRRRAAAREAAAGGIGMVAAADAGRAVQEEEDAEEEQATESSGSVGVDCSTDTDSDGRNTLVVDDFSIAPNETEDDWRHLCFARQLQTDYRAAGKWLAARPDGAERYRWLKGQGFELGGLGMLREAVRCGNTGLVEELLGEGSRSSSGGGGGGGGRSRRRRRAPLVENVGSKAVNAAAERGHVGVLRALHARGRRMDRTALLAAAGGGHVEAVEWLLRVVTILPWEVGYYEPLEEQQLQLGQRHGDDGQGLGRGDGEAGSAGQVVVLPKPLLAELLTHAARSGSRRLVVWLVGLGCPWSEAALAAAAEGGSEELVEWAVRSGGCTVRVSAVTP